MQAQSLLFDLPVAVPSTEGIKYAGSKLKLILWILELAKKTGAKSVFDGFSGSTRVSQAFVQAGYRVVSNDIAAWSKTLGTCYLKNVKPPQAYQPLIDHLNALAPEDGWFTEHYGGEVNPGEHGNAVQHDGTKKPWQKKNTRKLDAVRREIDDLELDDVTRSVALTSLMLALDGVDSTLGHFASYLKDWSARSFKDLELKVPRLWENGTQNTVLCGDVFDALADVDTELAYYDPPYGSNNDKMPPSRVRYAAYYHLWTTVCNNDRPPVFGKSRRREDTSDTVAASVFEEFRRNDAGRLRVVDAIERLLEQTPCKWILLSYSSGGRATAEELQEVICRNGRLVDSVAIDYRKNVMATMTWSNQWLRESEQQHKEFLFLIERSPFPPQASGKPAAAGGALGEMT